MENFGSERISTGDQIVDFCLNDCNGSDCREVECAYYGDLSKYRNSYGDPTPNNYDTTDSRRKVAYRTTNRAKKNEVKPDRCPSKKMYYLLIAVNSVRYSNLSPIHHDYDYDKIDKARNRAWKLISQACGMCSFKGTWQCRTSEQSLFDKFDNYDKSTVFKKNLEGIIDAGIDIPCGKIF